LMDFLPTKIKSMFVSGRWPRATSPNVFNVHAGIVAGVEMPGLWAIRARVAMSERRGILAAIEFFLGVARGTFCRVSAVRWLILAIDAVGEDEWSGSEGEKDCSGAHVEEKLEARWIDLADARLRQPECSRWRILYTHSV
jgi:hypothetical protein